MKCIILQLLLLLFVLRTTSGKSSKAKPIKKETSTEKQNECSSCPPCTTNDCLPCEIVCPMDKDSTSPKATTKSPKAPKKTKPTKRAKVTTTVPHHGYTHSESESDELRQCCHAIPIKFHLRPGAEPCHNYQNAIDNLLFPHICYTNICNNGLPPENYFCGNSVCNVLGCNCEGGCKQGDPYQNFKKRWGDDQISNVYHWTLVGR